MLEIAKREAMEVSLMCQLRLGFFNERLVLRLHVHGQTQFFVQQEREER